MDFNVTEIDKYSKWKITNYVSNGSLLYIECTKQQKDAGEYMKGLGNYGYY